jgi:hypothetical protein
LQVGEYYSKKVEGFLGLLKTDKQFAKEFAKCARTFAKRWLANLPENDTIIDLARAMALLK